MAVLIAELVQFILFVSTILTVYDSWKVSNNINLPIVVIAICAALFNACAFILRLPLPYYDFSNIEKLEQLEKSDPDKAARVRDRIIKVRESRERRNLLILETITIMIAIVITHVLWPGSGHLSGYMILIPMIYSPIVLYFINKPILERYEAHTIAALAKYREANELIQQYIKCKKRILFMRLFSPRSAEFLHLVCSSGRSWMQLERVRISTEHLILSGNPCLAVSGSSWIRLMSVATATLTLIQSAALPSSFSLASSSLESGAHGLIGGCTTVGPSPLA